MWSIKVYINKLTVPPTLMVNLVGPNPLNLCLAKKPEEHGYSIDFPNVLDSPLTD